MLGRKWLRSAVVTGASWSCPCGVAYSGNPPAATTAWRAHCELCPHAASIVRSALVQSIVIRDVVADVVEDRLFREHFIDRR